MLLVLPIPMYIFSKVYLSENPCNKRMSYTYCTRIIDAHTSTSCFDRAEHSSLLFFGMFFKARYYINIASSHTMNPESSYNTFDIEMIIKAQIPCDKNESRPEKYWTNDLHQSPVSTNMENLFCCLLTFQRCYIFRQNQWKHHTTPPLPQIQRCCCHWCWVCR